MNQAKIVDVHRYYRTGGIDWVKVKEHCDGIIISAGVGMGLNNLLKEQVDGAIAHNVPYMTYLIPSPNYSMVAQAENYYQAYGVKDAWTCEDIEKPASNIRCVNASEAHAFAKALEDLSGKRPLIYANPVVIRETLKFPAWLIEYYLWLAQWIYRFWPFFYSDFDSFLAKHANKYPPFVRGTIYEQMTLLWQYSAKGDGQKLCASEFTNDPIYRLGIKDADLDISTCEKDLFFDNITQPTPPPVINGDWYRIDVSARNIRQTPNSITGKVLITLSQNDMVKITEMVAGVPGTWGKVVQYKYSWQADPSDFYGYIYMNNLIKV